MSKSATDYLIWMSTAADNACWLGPVEKYGKNYHLPRGIPLAASFPPNVQLRMNKTFPKATALTDDLKNGSPVKICSQRLVAFLKERQLTHVEYLPVTILDHKGKVASKEYRLVNPVGLQDALDRTASEPTHNLIKKDQIDSVKRIVLDVSKLDPAVKVFRLAGFYSPVLIARDLADAINAQGFVGSYFRELKDYPG